MMTSLKYDPSFAFEEDERKEAGGAEHPIGRACGCISYEVILLGVGVISILGLVVPIFFDEGTSTIYAATGIKVIWCGIAVAGVINKSHTCMFLCMICNIFIAGLTIYNNFYWAGIRTFSNVYTLIIPAVIVEGFLCILADDLRMAYQT